MLLSRRTTLFGLLATPAIIRTPKLLMRLAPPTLQVSKVFVNYDILDEEDLFPTYTRLRTIHIITKESFALWRNSNAFFESLNKEWDTSGAKIGSTLRIRLPNQKEKNYG